MPVHYSGPPLVGYCTNVHAGRNWSEIQVNLERHAVRVRELLAARELSIGLWLSAAAAREIVAANRITEMREWLANRGLRVFTLNGFPYGDFHQPVVKHAVYEPNWTKPARAAYTRDLAEILCALTPEGAEGSISTLPLGWGPTIGPADFATAARQLLDVCAFLRQLERDYGRLIHLDLEPEPGCALQYSSDVVRFFESFASLEHDELSVRRYLRVCHDICHAAVMFEEQADCLRRYEAAGIAVGKVQVSSALRAPFAEFDAARRQQALSALASFEEPRYLHQTVIRDAATGELRFFDDLPVALTAAQGDEHLARGEWRIHFHVPIYLSRAGVLSTTQSDTLACLNELGDIPLVHHFEVETYAWNVLPDEFRTNDLPAGIARELGWLWSVAPWVREANLA